MNSPKEKMTDSTHFSSIFSKNFASIENKSSRKKFKLGNDLEIKLRCLWFTPNFVLVQSTLQNLQVLNQIINSNPTTVKFKVENPQT